MSSLEYAAGTAVDHFSWWCEEHLVQSVDQFAGKPLLLEPWQLEFMAEALAVDEEDQSYWQSNRLDSSERRSKSQGGIRRFEPGHDGFLEGTLRDDFGDPREELLIRFRG